MAQNLGRAVLIGPAAEIGDDLPEGVTVFDPHTDPKIERYVDFYYGRMQRSGLLHADCRSAVCNDYTVTAACMSALADVDGMVAGAARSASATLERIRSVLRPRAGKRIMGFSILPARGKTLLAADVLVSEFPEAAESAVIARQGAEVARRLGLDPRIAFLSYSTFGHPDGERTHRVRQAVALLDEYGVDFTYEGDVAADVALNPQASRDLYPFSRLKDYANVLIMPSVHAASIAVKMTRELGNVESIGPVLYGFERSVQIVAPGAGVSEILNMAALAAFDLHRS